MTVRPVVSLCASVCAMAALGGCATPSPYGNFVRNAVASFEQTIAADAARQVAAIHPPANTRVDLRQATPDAFGTSLVQALRARGYAVSEQGRPLQASTRPATASAPVAPGLPMRYVLDHAGGPDLYRVTLSIGDQSLARAYLMRNGTAHPAGAWVRKE